jgi:hypothetical protein
LVAFISHQPLPFVATIKSGKVRSIDQNRLQWLWASEAAEQRADVSPLEVQHEWKALFGAPLLAEEDEAFAKVWLRAEIRLTWEERVAWMRFVPVTSLMTSKQLSRYLDEVYKFNTDLGLELTNPEDLKWGKA